MEEDSLQFWIIPIVFLAVGIGIFVVIVEYNFNVLMPNAQIELEEMKKMSCSEIKSKDARNEYWTRDNGAFGSDRADSCVASELAIKKAEQEKLDKLLADPNSFESLSRDLKKFQELYDSHQELYEFHTSESEILKQNVTDFENKINQINSQLAKEYRLK